MRGAIEIWWTRCGNADTGNSFLSLSGFSPPCVRSTKRGVKSASQFWIPLLSDCKSESIQDKSIVLFIDLFFLKFSRAPETGFHDGQLSNRNWWLSLYYGKGQFGGPVCPDKLHQWVINHTNLPRLHRSQAFQKASRIMITHCAAKLLVAQSGLDRLLQILGYILQGEKNVSHGETNAYTQSFKFREIPEKTIKWSRKKELQSVEWMEYLKSIVKRGRARANVWNWKGSWNQKPGTKRTGVKESRRHPLFRLPKQIGQYFRSYVPNPKGYYYQILRSDSPDDARFDAFLL